MLPETLSHKIYFASSSKRKRYYAIAGGMIQSRVELGSAVKAGDRLYQIISFNKEGKLPTIIDVGTETDGLVYDISTN